MIFNIKNRYFTMKKKKIYLYKVYRMKIDWKSWIFLGKIVILLNLTYNWNNIFNNKIWI
jgi:multisubunit Na+/H+ antiporter MnhB subunit